MLNHNLHFPFLNCVPLCLTRRSSLITDPKMRSSSSYQPRPMEPRLWFWLVAMATKTLLNIWWIDAMPMWNNRDPWRSTARQLKGHHPFGVLQLPVIVPLFVCSLIREPMWIQPRKPIPPHFERLVLMGILKSFSISSSEGQVRQRERDRETNYECCVSYLDLLKSKNEF